MYFFNLKSFFIFFVIIIVPIALFSQDVENITKKFKDNTAKVTGSLSTNHVFNTTTLNQNRRSPYAYFIQGNLNLSAYGWNIPLSFMMSDQQAAFNHPQLQPFNQYGLSPYYKWVKLHIGRRNMNFSNYTLNKSFYGVGAELSPTKLFKFSFMYGKLNDAIKSDTALHIKSVYKRMAYCSKIEFYKDDTYINLILSRVWDDEKSLNNQDVLPTNNPMDNIVLNVNIGTKIMKRISFTSELASSGISHNKLANEDDFTAQNFYQNYPAFLFSPNNTTEFKHAIKSSLGYNTNRFSLGVNHEKIEPGFISLGVPYLLNDNENITVFGKITLFKAKVMLSTQIGKQRNNLNNENTSTNKNTVGSFDATLALTPKLNISGSYSNFTSFALVKSQFEEINKISPLDYIDTLDYKQISQNSQLNFSYVIGKLTNPKVQQNINAFVSYQKTDVNETSPANSQNSNTNASIIYAYSFRPLQMTIVGGYNSNLSMFEQRILTMGPTLSVSKTYMKDKLKTSLVSTYNNSRQDGSLIFQTTNFRVSNQLRLRKSHVFSLNCIVQSRFSQKENYKSFSEINITISYRYDFKYERLLKKKTGQ